jgi:hypothetical protein
LIINKKTTMSKHTPTPWIIDATETNIIRSNFGVIAKADGLGSPDLQTDKANAQRIVTCVNAMEGLSNEQVEGIRELIKDMAEYINDTFSLNEHGDKLRSKLIEQSQQYIKP